MSREFKLVAILSCFYSFTMACAPTASEVKDSAVAPIPTAQTQVNLADLPPDPSKAFVNLVSVNIKAELLEEFLSVLKPYASETRKEPGVLRYDIHQSPHDATVIELYEFYKDTAARLAHNNSTHRNAFFAKVKERGYFKVPAVSKVVFLIDPVKN